MISELDENLRKARAVYAHRGFQNRIGYGSKPAIVNVDLANAWTRDGSPFSCDNMETVISNVCRILDAAREKGVPVFFITTAYDPDMKDAGLWPKKIPALETLKRGREYCEIDTRLDRREGEPVIVKKMASAFDGTDLYARLRKLDIDTVLVTGVTASCCVRKTVEDAVFLGFINRCRNCPGYILYVNEVISGQRSLNFGFFTLPHTTDYVWNERRLPLARAVYIKEPGPDKMHTMFPGNLPAQPV